MQIVKAIGDQHQRLDSIVHGILAACGLRRALANAHITSNNVNTNKRRADIRDELMAAIDQAPLTKLHLSCQNSKAGTAKDMMDVVQD